MLRCFCCILLLFSALPALAQAPPPAPGAELRQEERGHAVRYPARPGGATASGEAYNPERLTAAHATLPFGTLVEVSNPAKGQTLTVRVNDRDTGGALLRLSARAADRLGLPPGGAEVSLRLYPEEFALLDARRQRLAAQVTPVEPLAPTPPVEARDRGRFTVQLGSFSEEARARARAAEVPGAWVGPAEVAGRRVYRVNVGRYDSADAAAAEHARLTGAGVEGFVKGLDDAPATVRPTALGDG